MAATNRQKKRDLKTKLEGRGGDTNTSLIYWAQIESKTSSVYFTVRRCLNSILERRIVVYAMKQQQQQLVNVYNNCKPDIFFFSFRGLF